MLSYQASHTGSWPILDQGTKSGLTPDYVSVGHFLQIFSIPAPESRRFRKFSVPLLYPGLDLGHSLQIYLHIVLHEPFMRKFINILEQQDYRPCM